MTEIAPGIFVHNGVHEEASPANDDGIANIGFIVGDEAVAVIDPGGSAERGARVARGDPGAHRPADPVCDPDPCPSRSIFGAAAFRDDHPDFIGHAKLPGALAQRGSYYFGRLRDSLGESAEGSEVVSPTRLVTTRLDLDLGGRRLAMRAHGPAHTDNDLTVLDEKTRTLWLADLLFVDRIPVIDGSLVGWLKELDGLTALSADRAVPGHGPVAVAWPAAAGRAALSRSVARDTRAAIKAGIGIANAYRQVGNSERGHWLLFDEYHPRNVTASYKELEWE